MKQEHNDSNTVTPMLSSSSMGGLLSAADSNALYRSLFSSLSNSSPNNLLASQMFNHAIISRLASVNPNFYPNALFSPWTLPPNTTSPPISPISPSLSVKKQLNNNTNINNNNSSILTVNPDHMSMNNNCIKNNNNVKSRNLFAYGAGQKANNNNNLTQNSTRAKSKRKTTVVKGMATSPVSHLPYQSMQADNMDLSGHVVSPGPISPPTTGSSPQSTGSLDHPNTSGSSSTIAPVAPAKPKGTKSVNRDKIFTCKTCDREFGYKHVLQNHERTHTGEKPFVCPEPNCNKRFTRDHHLKTHMRLHTGEKPYHCDFCDRKFVQVANLRRHLRVHTGDRPYKCVVCDSNFSDSNQLKAHMLVHNDEKPEKCDACGTRFRRRHHLTNHKCRIVSPPTPVMSPAMSIGNKSTSSRSDISEHSLDVQNNAMLNIYASNQRAFLQEYAAAKAMAMEDDAMPLDLSTDDSPEAVEKRNRKSHDVRRILRMPPQIVHIKSEEPVQTEPEDLSMHSPRSASSALSNVDDLDDLDDAASLYRKHNRAQSISSCNSSNIDVDDHHHSLSCCYCDQKFEKNEQLEQHLHSNHTLLPMCTLPQTSPTDLS